MGFSGSELGHEHKDGIDDVYRSPKWIRFDGVLLNQDSSLVYNRINTHVGN